jgi:ferredoxin
MQTLSFLEDLVSDTTQPLEFVEKRCLRRRLNSCECRSCLDCCPAGALSLENRKVQLDIDKCSGCMQCTGVCPAEAFLLPGYDIEQHLGSSTLDTELSVFSCTRQGQVHPEESVVPCLGIFSPELLLFTGMTGPAVIAFNMAECSHCENKEAVDSFLFSLKFLQEHASDLLTTDFLTLEHPNHLESLRIDSRRPFLTGLKNNLISFAASHVGKQPVKEPDTSIKNRRVPRKLRLIEKLIEGVDLGKKELILSFCVYRMSVNSQCTLCPRCTGICPTGALKVDKVNGEKQLLFKNALCSGCGLCVTFCQENAINLLFPLSYRVSKNKRIARENSAAIAR